VPGQAGTVRAGTFHTDLGDGSERGEPVSQLGAPGGGGGERFDAEHPAVGVECGGDVNVEVRVDSARDRARRLYDGHGHPFFCEWWRGGTHVPGRRP